MSARLQPQPQRSLPLHGLAALRIMIVLAIGLGYASTMGVGTESLEWGHHWGYDPSWYGLQLLFILSGFLAARSLSQGRSVREFFASRFWSLWPALIAATFVSVAIIYPLMCVPNAPMKIGDLAIYFIKTITLIDPGAQMPGLLDDAKYTCLLQGAIWTLRWGLILHIAFLIGWKLRILQSPKLALGLSLAAIVAYVAIVDHAVATPEFGERVKPVLPGLRLGYAYLVGVAVFHWQGRLRLHKLRIILSSLAIAAAAFGWHQLLPWSAALEIIGTTFWLTLCLGFLAHAPKFLHRCPRLAPVLYVSIWPAAQLVVALVPNLSQMAVIETSIALACLGAMVIFVLLRQVRVQPARF